jgi:hypothetical protein
MMGGACSGDVHRITPAARRGAEDTRSMWFLVTLLVTWAVAAGALGVVIGRTTRLRDASF